jgi:hypothetical protein
VLQRAYHLRQRVFHLGLFSQLKAYIKNKNFLLKRTYDWGQIDTVIEKEWEKESY